ncbi:MAG: PEGA domain-containing protein [Myxococcota bacterium]
MTTNECDRWASLADQDALGEVLSVADARFLRDHAQHCGFCRAESRAYDSLAGALRDETKLTEPFALLDAGRVGWRERFGARSARVKWLATGLAAAAALALIPAVKRALAPTSAAIASAAPSAATLVLRAGQANVNGGASRVGEQLAPGNRVDVEHGRACAGFEPGVWACLGDRSSVEVGALGEHRSLKLLRGRVLARLEPQPAGRTFAVEAVRVSVLAKGTLFAVELDAQDTLVRLYEGSVQLRAVDGRELTLRAPAAARVGAQIEARLLPDRAPPQDQELIALSRIGAKSADSRLAVTSLPAGAQVSLDGTVLGPAPISALVPNGAVRLGVELGGYAPVTERITLSPASSTTRDYELSALEGAAANEVNSRLPTPRAGTEAAGESVARATPAELLTRARSARAAGRYADAARQYRQLLQVFPQSDEARVSLVSLGELSLSELGDARAALQSFDAYLKHGGGLTQEARYGRIRALGRLGRRGEERSAIESFLNDYPKSVQAASLRAKLENR